ncbi:phosphatidylcholine synthase [Legionella birminghamensis]|uniref:Phosphatidylcholine synthase n=1 Tax=Legionella birminghamensis TaxID=28083 RepID=A0A378IBH5_9GAMM|nr:CDP-alcohol phosphatidyltransferase family protein [Legionella birminghamensis]KTC75588.1 phosphatidylcholine synthase [Legionella birminghamensis]STX31911.1 phosphatidylcholine synthase [Legionella birminghamensis]
MTKQNLGYRFSQYLVAWAVHAFTASAAYVGILTLIKIYQQEYQQALWYMAIAVVIDALDGTFARLVKVKMVLPNIDGALLDNLVDYVNYVITPCFFLYVKADMLPPSLNLLIIIAITITSSYQFTQSDAKTPDHFFKGFPCYWNIVIFYMFIFNTSMYTNALILGILCLLVFVPVKYVYPSRLDYLTESKALKILMHVFSIMYGICSAIILWTYPVLNPFCLAVSLIYIVIYLALSIYRTYYPMIKSRIIAHREELENKV